MAMLLWTSTLSMTTCMKSGETRPKSCRKNEPTRTSPSCLRYLTMAGSEELFLKHVGKHFVLLTYRVADQHGNVGQD